MTDRIAIGLDTINNKLKILLEENKRTKQQYEILQEENRETSRINSDLKETLQRFEERQRLVLILEKQKLEESKRFERQYKNLQEENREFSRINSELKVKLQERDEQLEKLQRNVLNFEKQKIEIQVISQNIEKTLEMLKLDEVNLNNDKILEETNKPLISEKSEQKSIINNEITGFPLIDNYSFQLSEHSCSSFSGGDCIRVVVGPQVIISNDRWPKICGELKVNTVLQYDEEYNKVISWGAPALFSRPNRRKRISKDNETKPVELFKLHLSNLPDELKPKLPVRYEKAITDYLREIGKETIATTWQNINFFEHVLLVLTIPADYLDKAKAIMRECAFKAGLVGDKYSMKLQCITESRDLRKLGTTFMVVDCGDTIKFTTCKLTNETRVTVVTERSEICESTFFDAEFVKYLRKIIGDRPIDLLRENYSGQMQYMIQNFSQQHKYTFTGEAKDFNIYELDLEKTAPSIYLCITDNKVREWLEEAGGIIELDFNNMRSIFDPFIENVIQLIHTVLDRSRETCSEMFLIGSCSVSQYFQNRIKKEFQHRIYVSVPTNPMVAIAQGAVKYDLIIMFENIGESF
ncbi:2284_t:CDS:2 [Funneliformis geosporum]|nr:2284_t:CDS:2 [Funneliformis geosporum]